MKKMLWSAALLPVVACSPESKVDVSGPGLETREIIVVEGTAPCPPGYAAIIVGPEVYCAFGAGPATPPPPPAEPGGGGPGTNPPDPGTTEPPPPEVGETPAQARFRERQRIRNRQCTKRCIDAQMPLMEDCFKWGGYAAPPDGVCPFGASTSDPLRCPGFWELCVFNHVNGHGTHAPTESCLDANGDFVVDDPTCDAELAFCISTWEQNLNNDDWLGCLMNDPTSNTCIQQCFEDWSVDGSPCTGALDGDSSGGTVDGGVMEGSWCTNGQSSIDCSAVGFVKCQF